MHWEDCCEAGPPSDAVASGKIHGQPSECSDVPKNTQLLPDASTEPNSDRLSRRSGVLNFDRGTGLCSLTGPQSSYYLPGQVEREPVLFLLDTGCALNILSKRVFARLPTWVRCRLNGSELSGRLADGSVVQFLGELTVRGRIRSRPFEVLFTVAEIEKDAILGMPFFCQFECGFSFKQSTFQFEGKGLKCVSDTGQALNSNVHVCRTEDIPPGTERHVQCRISQVCAGSTGMVEQLTTAPVLVASSIHHQGDRKIVVRCMNPTNELVRLKPGKVIASFSYIAADAIYDRQLDLNQSTDSAHMVTSSISNISASAEMETVPDHLTDLYTQAAQVCSNSAEQSRVRWLLHTYSDVFSSSSSDVGRTELVQHSIPLLPGTTPIRHAP